MRDAGIPELADSIAVIGMAGRFPGAANLDAFWRNLAGGVESISFFTDGELAGVDPAVLGHPHFVKAKGVLDDIELFDAGFFAYTPPEARAMDPQHRLFLECGWEALENAGYDPDRFRGTIGVYAGLSINGYLLANLHAYPEITTSLGVDKDFLATRLSYKLNLKGPSMVVQTACSTSLVAICQACASLLSYQCDAAIAGGVSITIPKKVGYWYQEGGIGSPDGHCRAFDAKANGTVAGNGIGVVVLKRLPDAINDGDRIDAVIRGFAVNNDGALKIGYTAPSVQGQAQVITAAQALAGVDADTITYVEAHGTGTALGDPIEFAALTEAFRRSTPRTGFCAIGSVKTNIGHLDAAAGVASFIKTVLALKHRQLPPSLHFEQPNPKIDFERSPFYVNTALRDWTAAAAPRRAGVSSFGIGGTNAHVVLEEPPAAASSGQSRAWQLLTLSARSQSALETQTQSLRGHLAAQPDLTLADVAYTLHLGRKRFPVGRTIVCRDVPDALRALESMDSRVVASGVHEAADKPVVFMFPGQGVQYPEMALQLYESEPTFRKHVDECCSLLIPHCGYDLRRLLLSTDDERGELAATLQQTAVTQPALFVVEYALARLWMAWGVRPAALIGHSIGEYVAACLSGVLQLPDALKLVALRGRLMQESPAGQMVAVPLPESRVRDLIGANLWVSAVNAPSLCVVGGATSDIETLEQTLRDGSVTYQRLRTGGAFHTALMENAVGPLEAALRHMPLARPRIPYVSNVSGTWITEAETQDPAYWGRHVLEPVRFAAGIDTLLKWGAGVFLEVGPGQTLASLVRHQAPGRSAAGARSVVTVSSLQMAREGASDLESVTRALGELWLAGVEPDWSAYHATEKRRRVALPTYPFERKKYWAEPTALALPSAAPSSSAQTRRPLDEWFAIPSWKRSVVPHLHTERAVTSSRCLLFLDGSGAGESIADLLERRGYDVITAHAGSAFRLCSDRSYLIDPASRADYDALAASLRSSQQMPNLILHLWGLSGAANDHLPEDDAQRLQERGFYSLLYLAQAFSAAAPANPIRVVVVTDGVHDVTGDDEVCPEKATVLGPCRVMPLEMPTISCQNIDFSAAAGCGPRAIEQLVAEIEGIDVDPVVAYRGIDRWIQTFEPARIVAPQPVPDRLREGGVYLITGGLGAVGMEIARYLAGAVRAKLVLVGRTTIPDRAQWQKHVALHGRDDSVSRTINAVRALEALGAEVLLARADVASEVQMRTVIETARRRFGAIDGVVHAAGIPGGGVIQLRDPAAAAAVMRAKVAGTRVLERLLADERLEFMVLCSSLTGITGAVGQVDYTAANAYLDAFARYHTVRGTFTVSIDWDTWREGGMAVEAEVPRELAQARADALAHGVSNADGVEVFRRSVAGTLPQVLVSTRGWGVGPKAAPTAEPNEPVASPAVEPDMPINPRPTLATPYQAPADDVQQFICATWQETLGLSQVGIHDSFFDLGGHSLHAIHAVSRLNAAFGTSIPVARLYEGLTPAFWAGLVREAQQGRTEADADPAKRHQRLSQQKRHQERRRAAKTAPGRLT
ncbi:MAG TPA: SDR family oxidoreductase [Vicinamibacterales bacterium]